LIFESTQHVSGNLLLIFRSVRLWFTAMWCMCSVWEMLLEQHPSHRTHSLRRRTPDLQPTTTLGQYTTSL